MFSSNKLVSLRILGMSWGVKTTCLEAPGVSLGGSGVSMGGVRSLRVLRKIRASAEDNDSSWVKK